MDRVECPAWRRGSGLPLVRVPSGLVSRNSGCCAGLLLALCCPSSVSADVWNGAGWYVVRLDTAGNLEATVGPYSDREKCEREADGTVAGSRSYRRR